DFGYLFGDQSVLKRAPGGVPVGPVVESHRAQLHQCRARVIHVGDVVLEAARRTGSPQLAIAVDHHSDGIGDPGRDSTDAGHKEAAMVANHSATADSDGVLFRGNALVAQIDVAASSGLIDARTSANGDVIA